MTLEVLLSGRTPYNVDKWGLPVYYTHNISDISILNSQYTLGDSYPTLVMAGSVLAPQSSDELNKINIQTLNYLFYGDRSMLYDLYEIPYEQMGLTKLMNSAMIPVDDVYLCIQRKGFYWLDKNFKLDLNNNRETIDFPQTRISEEDHRLLQLPNGDIFIVYTAILDTGFSAVNKAGYRILKKTGKSNGKTTFTLSDQTVLYKDDIMSNLKSGFEKNWTPFNYKDDQIFFIQSFQPFIVYKLDKPSRSNSLSLEYHFQSTSIEPISYKGQSVQLVSSVDCPEFSTYFGKVRGGTQAMLVRGQYFALYHTYEPGHGHLSTILPDNHFYYFIGAYTFTTDPPFRVTSFSRFPISHDSFVPGIYKVGKQQALLSFALSYVLINKDGTVILEGEDEDEPHSTTVVLTIGVRDTHTIVAKINLNELLDSLKPIVC
eukprot:gene20001-25974_t